MMRPVKSRNGNNLRAKEESRPDRRARFCSSFTVNPGSEMKFEINLVFCALVVLTGSSQARAQSSASPPVLPLAAFPDHAGSSASPDPTEDSGKKVPQQIPDPAGGGRASAKPTTATETEGANSSEAAANAVTPTHTLAAEAAPSPPVNVPVVVTALPDTASPTAAADSLSSAPAVRSTVAPRQVSPTAGGASLTRNPLSTLSSQPDQDTTSTAHASTLPRSESPTTASTQAAATTATAGGTLTLAPGRVPAGPTHQEVPSELNVGDEGLKGPHYGSPLDPLLASLLSVFIVTTAIVFVILFLKFRQRTNHPEFHRLQDLPMDDLMEDTPLSRYSY